MPGRGAARRGDRRGVSSGRRGYEVAERVDGARYRTSKCTCGPVSGRCTREPITALSDVAPWPTISSNCARTPFERPPPWSITTSCRSRPPPAVDDRAGRGCVDRRAGRRRCRCLRASCPSAPNPLDRPATATQRARRGGVELAGAACARDRPRGLLCRDWLPRSCRRAERSRLATRGPGWSTGPTPAARRVRAALRSAPACSSPRASLSSVPSSR